MAGRGSDGAWVVLGSVVVAAGMALAGISAFDGEVLLTLAGFLVFFAGYWLSKGGVSAGDVQPASARSAVDLRLLGRLSLIALGGVLAAVGVTMFADTVVDPDAGLAALSGVSCICGYMSTHVGINGNLL